MWHVQRVWKIVVLVLTVVVITAAGYVLTRHDPVPQAGESPGYAESTASRSPTPSVATGTSARPVKVVFLGDDYAAGRGASSPAHGWTGAVAGALHLDASVVAEPGAGYATPGVRGGSYAALVGGVVAAKPQVVLVSGGRNDVGAAPATLRAQTRALFARLKAELPDARLLAIAPWWGDSAHPPKLAKVDAAVRAGVEAAGGTYLDAPDPLRGHPSWMADAADPTDRGYAAIARAVTDALRAQLPR
jgi:lysophospholipase L1-like esterase